jgi:hypothetical protein
LPETNISIQEEMRGKQMFQITTKQQKLKRGEHVIPLLNGIYAYSIKFTWDYL